jgi:hypothetical protein
MSRTPQTLRSGWLRIAVLGVAALLLAGCATGYTFVQPDAVGGGYYTGSSTYASPGYYYDDAYGANAWFPGYAGFGYGPYYGSSISFGLGLGNPCGWGCGSYYGGWPWYYGGVGYPYWGYYRRNHHRRHHGGHDPVAGDTSPRPWRHPDQPRVPSIVSNGGTPPIAVPERPRASLVDRRPLESAGFAPHEFPSMRAARPMGVPVRPVSMAPQAPAFSEPPLRMAPIRSAPAHGFAPARPAFAPPPPPAPVSNSRTPATRIR